MPKRTLPLTLLLAFGCAGQTDAGQTPVYKLLYSPASGAVPGGNPNAMIEVEPGLFDVLAIRDNGTSGPSIFSISSTGTFNLIYSFQPPSMLMSTFVQAPNGLVYVPGFIAPNNFYFSLAPAGKDFQQYPFPGHWGTAWQTLVVPPNELYDIVAVATGGPSTYGFAQIDEAGKIAILHQFSGNDGVPIGNNITYGADGNIYGVGSETIGVSPGFIFRFTPTGAYSKLLSFPSFPDVATLALISASDGNLYGIFGGGGSNNTGEIYQATLSGQLQTVASFPATGMTKPLSLMEAADGNIYGSTNSNFIFRYNLTTHQLTPVYRLDPYGSQGHCACQLVEGMDGKLYGVTPIGGNYPGIGAVFSLNIGLPKPKPFITGLYPSSGPVGQRVILWGNYLLGTNSVAFNGVPATSAVATSAQSVLVTVPAGAATGPVTITTANGSFTTGQNFTIQ